MKKIIGISLLLCVITHNCYSGFFDDDGPFSLAEIERIRSLNSHIVEGMPQDQSLEKLLTTGSCENGDLSTVNLSKLKFPTHANLRGADLSNAILNHAILPMCDLTDTVMHGVQARSAQFKDATLDGVNTEPAPNAPTEYTDFTGANFDGTSMCGVHMNKTNFEKATFSNVTVLGKEELTSISSQFNYCTFKNAKFFGSKFNRASFIGSYFKKAKFKKLDKRKNYFIGADLTGALFLGAEGFIDPEHFTREPEGVYAPIELTKLCCTVLRNGKILILKDSTASPCGCTEIFPDSPGLPKCPWYYQGNNPFIKAFKKNEKAIERANNVTFTLTNCGLEGLSTMAELTQAAGSRQRADSVSKEQRESL